ncbi:PREDICTED: alanine--tRNA ligase, mitochondrial-like isoform X1 [Polistes canadensis]|uniref:alanine--tRNA ligase, mitochondrial-like isoform X1 n=2 Tax=Polistes canadensis TaxID=91411 RepID=UPI000718DEE5|nr:PREDICTED: alanine--tRNA ligase, mitochondrial-like isoform X1 [Polistes canadensis]
MRKINVPMLLRSHCTKSMYKSSNVIRKEFLDYYTKELQHDVIHSSPVSLLNDHSTAFVNAGMNQFKGIFLGHYDPPSTRVVNSQKCIRVGGKHSDLDIVGNDTYHHTFFEMLGNWSFGDYFKEESCRYALDLLTGPYNIKKEFLYITYFGGCKELGLQPDTQCKDIWLSLGIPENRILPFGMKDNFWEMGFSGPCGPCTEIHVDITKQLENQSFKVNTGHPDIIELWNIVFIQFNRLTDNRVIQPLSKHHIDTGMGFERLVTLLQGKRSSYDTDLFQPLFETIRCNTNAPEYKGTFGAYDTNGIDYAYRILADHARMITVALCDGVIPEKNQKLRRILRKSIDMSENIFKKKGLLFELTYTVVDILGDAYPELQNNLKQVHKIIEFEESLYERLCKTSGEEWNKMVATRPELASITNWMASGLVNGYKDLQSILKKDKIIYASGILPGHVLFKLFDTHGLSVETISELAAVESLQVDKKGFEKEMDKARLKSKVGIIKNHHNIEKYLQLLTESNIPETDDSFKYVYEYKNDNYEFPKLRSEVIGLLVNGNIILGEELKTTLMNIDSKKNTNILLNNKDEIAIILNKTMFYSFEGGQHSDIGSIYLKDMIFQISKVEKINGYVIHSGKFVKNNLVNTYSELEDWNDCVICIDTNVRTSHMRNHTATHLLNAALRFIFPVVYQRSSLISKDILKFQFSSFGDKITLTHLAKIEELVNNVIKINALVESRIINLSQLLLENNVTMIPDEIYPHTGIRLIDINTNELKSKELCCGTHVKSTGSLEHFCILNYSSKGVLNCTIHAITGPLAKAAELTGKNLLDQIVKLENLVNTKNIKNDELNLQIKEIQKQLQKNTDTADLPLSYLIKEECNAKLQNLVEIAVKQNIATERSSIVTEVKNSMKPRNSFIVYHLQCTPKHLSLQDILSFFPNIPILVISYDKNVIKASCSVPQEFLSDTFNAQTWMKVIFQVLNQKYNENKGKNSLKTTHAKFKNISEQRAKKLIEIAIIAATEYVSILIDEKKVITEKN